MVDILHDLHLLINLRIDNTILHKLPLLNLLGRKLVARILICQKINSRESSLANNMLLVVLSSASPLLRAVADDASAGNDHTVILVCKEIRLTQLVGIHKTNSDETYSSTISSAISIRSTRSLQGPPSPRIVKTLKVLMHILRPQLISRLLSLRNPDNKLDIVILTRDHVDFDQSSMSQGMLCRMARLLTLGPQKLALDDSAIGRLVLKHDDAVLSDPDAEVDVGDTLGSILAGVGKDEITALNVASEDKPSKRILELSGKSKSQVAGNKSLLCKNHGIRRDDLLSCIQALDAKWHLGTGDGVLWSRFRDVGGDLNGGEGGWVEDAENVAGVLVGEVGVVLAQATWVDHQLGC